MAVNGNGAPSGWAVEFFGEAAGMRHEVTIVTAGEGQTVARCSCGWCSERFGAEKKGGTMDALQRARDAGDLHQWDADLPE